MRDTREELESEASFWQELIGFYQDTISEEELNDMRDALKLIEFKLAQKTPGLP